MPSRHLDSAPYSLLTIEESDIMRILEAYALLQQAMGTDAVEDLDSFRRTVSASNDGAVMPKLLCADYQGDMIGVIVGAYLRNLNMGFIAYSAVRDVWRRQGVYTAMRNEFIACLYREVSASYVISELEEDGWLYRKYLERWKAFALPCSYEQPEAQGLQVKPLKLVLQPVAKQTMPDEQDMLAILCEVYQRIYRISDLMENESFIRVVASLNTTSIAAQPS